MAVAATRTLELTTTPYPWGRYGMVDLVIAIDGVPQPAQWGTGRWQIPVDRPVTVDVHLQSGRRVAGAGRHVIPPGGEVRLEYKAPAGWGSPGALGPVGTVHHEGTDRHAITSAVLIGGVVLVSLVVVGIAIVLTYR